MYIEIHKFIKTIAIYISIVLGLFVCKLGADTIFDSVQLFDTSIELDNPPRMITLSKPLAPPVSGHDGETKSVWVKVLVGKRGWVKDVELLTPTKIEKIDKWLIEAAKGNKFIPLTVNTKTIETWLVYRLEFTLSNAKARRFVRSDLSIGVKVPKKMRRIKDRNIAIPATLPQPKFPKLAFDKLLQATDITVVWVKIDVNEKGIPTKAQVVHLEHKGFGFEEAAIDVAMKSEFEPLLKRGKPKSHVFYHSVIFIEPEIYPPDSSDYIDVQSPDSNGNSTD